MQNVPWKTILKDPTSAPKNLKKAKNSQNVKVNRIGSKKILLNI
jgi:hypothetical protein